MSENRIPIELLDYAVKDIRFIKLLTLLEKDQIQVFTQKKAISISNAIINHNVIFKFDDRFEHNGHSFLVRDVIFSNCKIMGIDVDNTQELSNLRIIKCEIDFFIVSQSSIKNIFIQDTDIKSFKANELQCESLEINGEKILEIRLDDVKSQEISIGCERSDMIILKKITTENFLEISSFGSDCHIDVIDVQKNVQKCKIYPKGNETLSVDFLTTSLSVSQTHLDISKVKFTNLDIKGEMLYADLLLNLTDITIQEKLELQNIYLGESYFRNVDLSKCQFNNSLISEAKFYECDAEKTSDWPLSKVNQRLHEVVAVFLFVALVLYLVSVEINIFPKEVLQIISLGLLIGTVGLYVLFRPIISVFINAKHKRTLDEIEAIDEDTIGSGFVNDVDPEIKKKYERLESIYRQLKVSFENDSNKQMANEFLYSEGVMKLRQKNLLENYRSVDFYNYLVNGFGRRWRRALSNFVTIFVLSIVLFSYQSDTYDVQNKAPVSLQALNSTKTNENHKLKEQPGTNTPPETSALTTLHYLELGFAYTLSKVDVLKVKTNDWFKEKNTWYFVLWNLIGLVLLFMLGSFILAFKRRLEK
ncbi:hypothetical protein ACXWTF_02585 [Thiomicrolovo sp. ZZH C-3]